MQGTKAASHMDISSEKTASSIRSVASTFLECLECLEDTENPFSIRDWIANPNQDSWLFLHCTPSQRSSVRPLLSAWISSAIKGLQALKPDLNRRIWFIIDELPSLQKVKDVEVLLTEGRKYGGCAVLSLQSPSQLESIYGRDVTKTIIGNTLTKIIFAEQDPEIAERISKSFGDCEIKEFHEGISYGAHEARDGVNLSTHMKHAPIVPSSKILSLPKNTDFLKLPGNYPVVKIRLKMAKK
jgi:type IV secretory pathway TraG/TraD family ATPase VirD4